FSHPHPWPPKLVISTLTSLLQATSASVTQHLSLLDCRGNDARDMQKTLNYITAELRLRNVNLKGTDADHEQAMKEKDDVWEAECGGNPKWGERRA
ncbi:hypothetical protein CC86DRAFT_261129, partial [Ophiobolus disseminans]